MPLCNLHSYKIIEDPTAPSMYASGSLGSTTESERSKRVQLPEVHTMAITIVVGYIVSPFHLSQMHPASESFHSPSLDILTQSLD